MLILLLCVYVSVYGYVPASLLGLVLPAVRRVPDMSVRNWLPIFWYINKSLNCWILSSAAPDFLAAYYLCISLAAHHMSIPLAAHHGSISLAAHHVCTSWASHHVCKFLGTHYLCICLAIHSMFISLVLHCVYAFLVLYHVHLYDLKTGLS